MNPNDPLGNGGEVLSQSEVERLLSEVQAEEAMALVIKAAGQKHRFKAEDIQPYDFRQPAFLTPNEMRKIRLRHEEFIRSLAARLSIYLRLDLAIQMSKLQTLSYQKFIDGLANPTHLTLFKAEPLKGVCLLEIPPRLGLTIVDRLLGGPAHSVTANRDLSEIETALLDQTVQIVLNEWCNLWEKMQDLHPVLLGHENNGRFLQTAPHDTILLALAMEVRLGDQVEQMQIAFPYFTIEPLIRRLSQIAGADKDPQRAQAAPIPWNPTLNDVPVQLTAEWQGLVLTARELAALQCGDVLVLDPDCFNQVQIQFERIPKYQGRLGTCGKNWAVELVGPVKF